MFVCIFLKGKTLHFGSLKLSQWSPTHHFTATVQPLLLLLLPSSSSSRRPAERWFKGRAAGLKRESGLDDQWLRGEWGAGIGGKEKKVGMGRRVEGEEWKTSTSANTSETETSI